MSNLYKVQPKRHTFHTAATTNATGEIFNLNGLFTALILTVVGASAWNGTVTFNASQNGTDYDVIQGENITSEVPSTTATGVTAQVFRFNVAGVEKFKCPITGVSTGNVTVKGTAIVADIGKSVATLTGSAVEDVTFHDAATVAADGAVLTVSGYKTLTVEIYGTSTSRTVLFKGRGPAGADRTLLGVNLATGAGATSTTGTAEVWQFDITGLTSVLMDLSAVAGGNVSIKGKAVA